MQVSKESFFDGHKAFMGVKQRTALCVGADGPKPDLG
jgi:hypothetical protein